VLAREWLGVRVAKLAVGG